MNPVPMSRLRTYIVGRERGCDVWLDDASVSRHHAEVVRVSGGRLYVTDRATTNGTCVFDGHDWRRIRQAFLKPGGRVRFGDVEMSAGRLDDSCPRADARAVEGNQNAGAVRNKEGSPGPNRSLVRDPTTGEIVEQEPRGRSSGRGGAQS